MDFSLVPELVADRRREADETRDAFSLPDPDWFDNAAQVVAAAQRLMARGATVAFVRFPTSGSLWQRSQHQYPRRVYWDGFAAAVGTVAVHFEDHASLSAFELPDYSHLDRRDKDTFTNALLDVLADRGVTFERGTRTAE